MTMLKLDMPSDEVRRQYKEKFRPLIIKRIKGELKGRKISNAARDILLPGWNSATPDTSRLDKLLVSEPKDLKDVNDDLWTQLQNLCFWNRPTKKALKDVFDYEHLIDKSKSNSFWLAQQIGRNTCTYCNRTYTFTVINTNSTHPEYGITVTDSESGETYHGTIVDIDYNGTVYPGIYYTFSMINRSDAVFTLDVE